jgi:hypothetical protein
MTNHRPAQGETGQRHWLVKLDPMDGEAYAIACRCEIGHDHDVVGCVPENPHEETQEGP